MLGGAVAAGLAGVIGLGLTGANSEPESAADDPQPRRVRVLGIDAPETGHPPDPAECYGDTATALLEQLVPIGVIVELVADAHQDDCDHYDRLLRYVDHRAKTLPRSCSRPVPRACSKTRTALFAVPRTVPRRARPKKPIAVCGAIAEPQVSAKQRSQSLGG